MRKFICIIGLLCSIFVSQAQLILPIGKPFTSQEVSIKRLNPVTDKFEQAEIMNITQVFTFVTKEKLIVKCDDEIIVSIKLLKPILSKKTGKIEVYYYTVSVTFDGETGDQIMGIYVDELGKLLGVAVGDDLKISSMFFENLQTKKS